METAVASCDTFRRSPYNSAMNAFARATKQTVTATEEVDWEAVYVEQVPRVYRFFHYRVGDSMLAEDLTAKTFEKAWQGRKRYRRDLAAFSTWLFTIARNVAVDHYREQRQEVSLEQSDHQANSPSVEEIVQRRIDVARLTTLLTQLSARERELLSLKYGAQLTNRAIAQITGLSESNVGTLLHRVVQKLKLEWEVFV
jgi:RNA polymerase sigma-70 factor (ECF subfamily)